MCRNVIHNNEVIESVGELRKLMPKLVLAIEQSDENCLCCVRIPETCAANGYECREVWEGYCPGDWLVWEKQFGEPKNAQIETT